LTCFSLVALSRLESWIFRVDFLISMLIFLLNIVIDLYHSNTVVKIEGTSDVAEFAKGPVTVEASSKINNVIHILKNGPFVFTVSLNSRLVKITI
jgi:hypothetical protein